MVMDDDIFECLTNFHSYNETVLNEGESIFNYNSPTTLIGNDIYGALYSERITLSIVFAAINGLIIPNSSKSLENDDLLYIALTRLVFAVNHKGIFKKAIYSIDVSDDIKLAIELETQFFDFFRIKLYLDFEGDEDIDIFLSYKKDGKNTIRQGNYELIGEIINELEINNSL